MILEGFKIMLLGMTTVFLFLSLLTIIISQFANLVSLSQSDNNTSDKIIPVQVITAAIAAYEDEALSISPELKYQNEKTHSFHGHDIS